MLTVEIKLNGKLIAGATAANVSELAAVSNYTVEAVEAASEETGLLDFHRNFTVQNHKRRQSVWELVHRIALKAMTENRPVEGSAR